MKKRISMLIIPLFMMMTASPQSNMSNVYTHSQPASFRSQAIQKLLVVLRRKKAYESYFSKNKFPSQAAEIPEQLLSDCTVQEDEVNGRKLWTISRKGSIQGKTILYIHGGGYICNLTKYDWKFIQELLVTNATIVVPDYPLAPTATHKEVYTFFDKLYAGLLTHTQNDDIIFLGNSAGGGIALGFAQKLRNENKPQPSQIILNAPWLDLTLNNPEIQEIDNKDKILSIRGLTLAGQAYSAGLDKKDYKVSPINGDFSHLGKISLFIGTHDLFYADSKLLREKLATQNIPFNYFEYPKMFHGFITLTTLKESKHAIAQIKKLIGGKNNK